jgi:hypothetical protein
MKTIALTLCIALLGATFTVSAEPENRRVGGGPCCVEIP